MSQPILFAIGWCLMAGGNMAYVFTKNKNKIAIITFALNLVALVCFLCSIFV